jgi:hypothetical protein
MFCCITISSYFLLIFLFRISVLRTHPPPCLLTLFSFPYRECLLVKRRLPKFLNILSDRVVTNTPEMSLIPALFFKGFNDADFANEITARPSLTLIFTRLTLCSLSLQPGLLRRILSPVFRIDYFVKPLRA